ncbi:hypothetical protein GGR27_002901 [Lewinella antarctica]|uniref:Uncharacterized protein n=1 Tax=Neolewinella antarctica TaxID=442734 RepID=A0ABX0XET3_9BACT|nr:hypothetical protein [Neolewinella antarctica]
MINQPRFVSFFRVSTEAFLVAGRKGTMKNFS